MDIIGYQHGGRFYELYADRPLNAAPVYRHAAGLACPRVQVRDGDGRLHFIAQAADLPLGWTLVDVLNPRRR
jgi:hypothetical protein